MNARSLTWRLLVPISLVIFLLVAGSRVRPPVAPYPGIEPRTSAGPQGPVRGVLPQVADTVLVRWQSLLDSAAEDPIATWNGNEAILLVALADGRSMNEGESAELRARLDRFRPDLILLPGPQGYFLPRFSRPERTFGASGLLRRLAEERDLFVFSWTLPDAQSDAVAQPESTVQHALAIVTDAREREMRVLLAGPQVLLTSVARGLVAETGSNAAASER